MMSLWLGIGALALAALGFIAWPLIRYGRSSNHLTADDVADRLNENIRLFREHVAELDQQLVSGRLDEQQHAQLKLEQERGLLDDEANLGRAQAASVIHVGVKSFLLLGCVVIVSAFLLYKNLGAGDDVNLQRALQDKRQLDLEDMQQNRTPDPRRARDLVRMLEARLADNPENLQYWFFLARAAMEQNDFAKAANAYQRVHELDKEAPLVMAELAQAMFLRDGNKMSPPIADLAKRALDLDPNNSMALGLAGIDAFSNQDYPNAIKYWQRVLSITGTNSAEAQSIEAGIDRALTLYAAAGGDSASLDKAINGRQISLLVSLGEGVTANPEQLVYVYARAWQGAKMPLAIARIKVADLPTQVLLTEAMAMSPAMSLAQATQVELVARISQDGSANAKVGDWEGAFGPVDVQAVPAGLHVKIDHQVAQ